MDAKRTGASGRTEDQVSRDKLWKDMLWKERRDMKDWEKKWGFLKDYDELGQLKLEELELDGVSLFSKDAPNTTNQILGSRLESELGLELIKLDRMLQWPMQYYRRKFEQDIMSC